MPDLSRIAASEPGRSASVAPLVHRINSNKQTFKFLRPPHRARLEEAQRKGGHLALLWVGISGYSLFVKLYGREMGAVVRQTLADTLERLAAEALREEQLIYVEPVNSASFLVLFQSKLPTLEGLKDLALTLRLRARNQLNQEVVRLTGQSLSVRVGYSLLEPQPARDLESQIFSGMGDARQVAEGLLDCQGLALMNEFRRVLEEPQLTAVYQPIVDLVNQQVHGWEALARGPEDSHFNSPKILFDFAEEVGSIFRLEQVCRERAFAGLGPMETGQKLFINIHPLTLGDPNFRSGETRALLDAHDLKPENVVFEITERHSIKDFTLFHRTLDHYRGQGYKVAIDDVGTGYSGLSRIAMLRPDYIKVDMSLVQGIDANPVQRALLETLVTFADNIGCGIVAEGIETPTELSCLVDMGVHFGQGFHLARPAAPKPYPASAEPRRGEARRRGQQWKCSIAVRELAEPCPTVAPIEKVREVRALLDGHPISGAVVVDSGRPLGLVMSHSLDRQLGTYFGTALYWDRPVDRVMDQWPLIVDAETPVEQVAKRAMGRERYKIYDYIVVTEEGQVVGIVSVQKMLDALAQVQVEMAKGANPLTGLPGNVSLEQEIALRCGAGKASSFVYVDLDNFKVYNDTYGFEEGDQMILLLTRVLRWAVRRHGGDDAYLGHVGGDDFIIICPPERAERLCQGVVRVFKRLAPTMFNAEDRARGYVEGKGRDGQPGRFPLTSVSLGIVDMQGQVDANHVGHRAAEVKRYAKSLPGSVYVRDRRQPLGVDEAPPEPAQQACAPA